MTDALSLGLRALVAETVRDVVADLVRDSVATSVSGGTLAMPAAQTPQNDPPEGGAGWAGALATGPGSGRQRTETVRISSDADLDAFARRLLEAFENPKARQDVRIGRLRFTLAPTPGTSPGPDTRTRRIDRGAVTERIIDAAHTAGESLVLARGAVITPLARERARTLGVHIEKEH